MNRKLPFEKITVREVASVPMVKSPLYKDKSRQVSQNEFFLKVSGVGCFYASNGDTVEYAAEPDSDPDWVRLYLNGQVLVALLHQNKIVNFHASSFIYNNLGIMIPGETGSGKSSITASFNLNGAGFLSDDMTPVIFKGKKPYIWPLSRAIKIDKNAIDQLNIDRKRLTAAEVGTGKFYFEVEAEDEVKAKVKVEAEGFPLDIILKIETGEVEKPEFHIPANAEKFSILRSEICSWEILAGMQETEKDYLNQLLLIAQDVTIVRLTRPAVLEISELHSAIEEYLGGGLG